MAEGIRSFADIFLILTSNLHVNTFNAHNRFLDVRGVNMQHYLEHIRIVTQVPQNVL